MGLEDSRRRNCTQKRWMNSRVPTIYLIFSNGVWVLVLTQESQKDLIHFYSSFLFRVFVTHDVTPFGPPFSKAPLPRSHTRVRRPQPLHKDRPGPEEGFQKKKNNIKINKKN